MSFVERQEGREFARSLLADIYGFNQVFFHTTGVQTVLENLEVTVKHYRGDYAVGINEIIQLARKATQE